MEQEPPPSRAVPDDGPPAVDPMIEPRPMSEGVLAPEAREPEPALPATSRRRRITAAAVLLAAVAGLALCLWLLR
jgi:hypothetical protein